MAVKAMRRTWMERRIMSFWVMSSSMSPRRPCMVWAYIMRAMGERATRVRAARNVRRGKVVSLATSAFHIHPIWDPIYLFVFGRIDMRTPLR